MASQAISSYGEAGSGGVETAPEGRRAPRTNLLLAATIDAGSMNVPVRIRNLSETGALIEGPALPALGERLVLRRLALQIGAAVVWSEGNRCGIAFDGTTSVAAWIAGARGGRDCGGGQARVDALQTAIRSGTGIGPAEPRPQPDRGDVAHGLDHRLAEELAYVRRLLESIGDELIEEPAVVQRHAKALQNFDIAGQILGHVADILRAGNRAEAVDAIGMEDLRARLIRKRLFRS